MTTIRSYLDSSALNKICPIYEPQFLLLSLIVYARLNIHACSTQFAALASSFASVFSSACSTRPPMVAFSPESAADMDYHSKTR